MYCCDAKPAPPNVVVSARIPKRRLNELSTQLPLDLLYSPRYPSKMNSPSSDSLASDVDDPPRTLSSTCLKSATFQALAGGVALAAEANKRAVELRVARAEAALEVALAAMMFSSDGYVKRQVTIGEKAKMYIRFW